MHCSQKLWKIR